MNNLSTTDNINTKMEKIENKLRYINNNVRQDYTGTFVIDKNEQTKPIDNIKEVLGIVNELKEKNYNNCFISYHIELTKIIFRLRYY